MLLKFSVPTLAVQRGGRKVILESIGRNAGKQKTWIENGKATERDTTSGEKKGIMHGARILAARREVKLMDSVASRNGQLILSILPQRRK
jgi:hypothetical protein